MKERLFFYVWGAISGLLASVIFLMPAPPATERIPTLTPEKTYKWVDPIIVTPKAEVTVSSPFNTTIETSEIGKVSVSVDPLDDDAFLAKLERATQRMIDKNEANRALPKFGQW